jgi:hypothetical protein
LDHPPDLPASTVELLPTAPLVAFQPDLPPDLPFDLLLMCSSISAAADAR